MANFSRYASEDVVISTNKLTTSTWSDNTNNLQTAFTASTDYSTVTSSGQFYLDVFNKLSTDVTSQPQYAVAYGNRFGSGSPDFTNDSGSFGLGASKVIYNQYRQLVFGDETQNFKFSKDTPPDIYVINLNRSRFKHNLKPGSLNLHLLTGSVEDFYLGKALLHLTDDSVTQTGSAVVTNLGRQFNIVSGSNGEAVGNTIDQVNNSASYGLFYPDAGIIILNPGSLAGTLTPAHNPGISTNTDLNHKKLYQAISGAQHFIVDSQEKVTSQYYFTRAKNTEFNYTTNPSFVDGTGDVNFTSMVDNPQTYITTIGLYNDSNDLVAVAKLSQPVVKDFTKEALIRVKLDY